MSEFGLHVTIDASGCNKRKLASVTLVYDILDKLPDMIGMTKMTLPYVVKWLDKFAHGTEGISGFVMIAESHISIHTFPQDSLLTADVYSCKPFDTEKAIKQFREVFSAQKVKKNILNRDITLVRQKALARR